MSDKDFELLLKMIGMTGSDNDNQAIVAMRKANDLAAKLGGWDAILRGKVKITVLADPFKGIDIPDPRRGSDRKPAAPPPPEPPRPPRQPRPQPQPQYQPYQPRPQPQPQPRGFTNSTQSASEPPPVVNKYEGTCTTCGSRVSVGAGLAYRSGGRWMTRHNPGQCPTKGARKAFTADDLQV